MAALYGRVYTVVFKDVAVTAQQDFFEIVAAAGKPLVILGLYLSQTTEVQDAQEEQLGWSIKSGSTTSGSGGTAPTPIPTNFSDAAAAFTAEVNNTTKATAGTIITHHVDSWNVRQKDNLLDIPEAQIVIIGGRRATIELTSTPADSITMSGTLKILELG